MAAPAILMSCIARGAAKHLANFLSFGLAGDVLADAWDAWAREADESRRKKEIEQLAAASQAEAREAARLAVAGAGIADPAARQRVEDCLANAPAAIRRSLRSPSDPSGRTLPPGHRLGSSEALRMLLPLAPTRFKAGDRPLPAIDWELEELLGVGGFGEVWRARNPHLPGSPPAALKFITDPQAQERLSRHEARVLAALQRHGELPGIVRLRQTYLSANPPCLEFDHIAGGDYAGLIRQRGEAGWQDAAREIAELVAIVGRAHRLPERIVHRDLKPANVLRGPSGLLVADFGIGGLAARAAAGQTKQGTQATAAAVAGSYTPLYASPQQMAGESADPRDDVFSLGVVWWQSLSGNMLLPAPTGTAWMRKLEAKGMPAELVAVLASMMEHERDDRPADGTVVAERIEALQTPKAKPKPAPPVPQRAAPPAPKPAPPGPQQTAPPATQSGKALVRPWVVGAIVLGLLVVSIPLASLWRGAAARARSADNLRQIGVALHAYHSIYNKLPAQAIRGQDGKALLSWRVAILPYLGSEQQALYNEFKLDEPWDGPHNKKLLAKMPKVYAPVLGKSTELGGTSYQCFFGRGAGFEGTNGILMGSITDGTANTLAVVEAGREVPWTKPEDIAFDPDKAVPALGGEHAVGSFALYFDGSVRILPRSMSASTLKALITRAGGEVLSNDI